MIEIDGSYGEGGGQVLRTALTLSTLTGQPVLIGRIRAGRRNPGLRPQHLTNVLALAQVSDANVRGAAIGSTEVVFQPRSESRRGNYVFDVAQAAQGGSAGSVTLIFQTLLLPLAFAGEPSQITLKGGTHVPWSPVFEYARDVYLPTVARMGVKAECQLRSSGFYPIGRGEITADIHALPGSGSSKSDARLFQPVDKSGPVTSPRKISPLLLRDRGSITRVRGTAVACNLSADIAQRMADRATSILRSHQIPCEVMPRRGQGAGRGAFIFLIAEYEYATAGFSALGERGKPSEKVAEEACQNLLAHHADGSPVDSHLADQLLLPVALAHGESKFRTSHVTRHLLTNAHVIRQFIPASIEIHGEEGEAGQVVVEGIGHVGS